MHSRYSVIRVIASVPVVALYSDRPNSRDVAVVIEKWFVGAARLEFPVGGAPVRTYDVGSCTTAVVPSVLYHCGGAVGTDLPCVHAVVQRRSVHCTISDGPSTARLSSAIDSEIEHTKNFCTVSRLSSRWTWNSPVMQRS